MRRLALRYSKIGILVSALFLLAFLAVLAWVFLVASKNPADSGESGVLVLPFAMPWVMWLPVDWLGPWSAIACVLVNAVIVYGLFGGLRFTSGEGES